MITYFPNAPIMRTVVNLVQAIFGLMMMGIIYLGYDTLSGKLYVYHLISRWLNGSG